MNYNNLFTSESVTEGHPDKMCDIISDAILDAYLVKDPNARVACEVNATTDMITIFGEITSDSKVDIVEVARSTIKEIGYNSKKYGFNGDDCAIVLKINNQSEDINLGVSSSVEDKMNGRHTHSNKYDNKNIIGAGDQGMMFGYACNETENLMPAPIFYSHKLCCRLSYIRKEKILDYIGPDGKSMVTFEYCNNKPVRIHTIVISAQHLSSVKQEQIYNDIYKHVITPTIPQELMDEKTKILVNPTGSFIKGGPCADTGLTGRKIIVDTYGGMGHHGGGAFSGKDATKVDRTGAYAARYIAKNIVAADVASKCEIQIAYAIGVANPVSIHVDTFGTSLKSEDEITKMIYELFDLRPAAIIEQFDMKKPIYKQLASYGHFGRNELDVAWEMTDSIQKIREYFKGN